MDELDIPRKNLERLIQEHGVTLKQVSLAIGKNHAYLQQYMDRGVPLKLKEAERAALAKYFKVSEANFGDRIRGMSEQTPQDFEHFSRNNEMEKKDIISLSVEIAKLYAEEDAVLNEAQVILKFVRERQKNHKTSSFPSGAHYPGGY